MALGADDQGRTHSVVATAAGRFRSGERSHGGEPGRIEMFVTPFMLKWLSMLPVVIVLSRAKNKWRNRDPELRTKWQSGPTTKEPCVTPGWTPGSTTVAYIPDKGWFWYIPMRDNRVSVGVVADRDYLYRDYPGSS